MWASPQPVTFGSDELMETFFLSSCRPRASVGTL